MRLPRHKQFGSSGEKNEYNRLSLFDEAEVYADAKKPEPDITEVKAHNRKKAAEGKERLPEGLPVEIVEHTIPEEERSCPQCSEVLRVIGKTERDTLAIVSATATIRRDVCYTYACEHCEKHDCSTPILKAKAPTPLIKGKHSFSGDGNAYHDAKFVMASPLYHQAHDETQQELCICGKENLQ